MAVVVVSVGAGDEDSPPRTDGVVLLLPRGRALRGEQDGLVQARGPRVRYGQQERGEARGKQQREGEEAEGGRHRHGWTASSGVWISVRRKERMCGV